jgi:hypothetical protein
VTPPSCTDSSVTSSSLPHSTPMPKPWREVFRRNIEESHSEAKFWNNYIFIIPYLLHTYLTYICIILYIPGMFMTNWEINDTLI